MVILITKAKYIINTSVIIEIIMIVSNNISQYYLVNIFDGELIISVCTCTIRMKIL